jgi:hypothetical protein
MLPISPATGGPDTPWFWVDESWICESSNQVEYCCRSTYKQKLSKSSSYLFNNLHSVKWKEGGVYYHLKKPLHTVAHTEAILVNTSSWICHIVVLKIIWTETATYSPHIPHTLPPLLSSGYLSAKPFFSHFPNQKFLSIMRQTLVKKPCSKLYLSLLHKVVPPEQQVCYYCWPCL